MIVTVAGGVHYDTTATEPSALDRLDPHDRPAGYPGDYPTTAEEA